MRCAFPKKTLQAVDLEGSDRDTANSLTGSVGVVMRQPKEASHRLANGGDFSTEPIMEVYASYFRLRTLMSKARTDA